MVRSTPANFCKGYISANFTRNHPRKKKWHDSYWIWNEFPTPSHPQWLEPKRSQWHRVGWPPRSCVVQIPNFLRFPMVPMVCLWFATQTWTIRKIPMFSGGMWLPSQSWELLSCSSRRKNTGGISVFFKVTFSWGWANNVENRLRSLMSFFKKPRVNFRFALHLHCEHI